ncbi:MAG: RNA 2',3'-cyclic phosphodiesterase [Alphaproteobacteria bacterium]
MPRLFTAIEIPSNVAARLSMLRGKLSGARWIDQENYHITLRFAGDVDDVTANAFASALEEIQFESFELSINGLGSFGGNKPRALWAGFQLSEPLIHLQKAHERAARLAGLPPESRNFTPHVTLARLHDTRASAVADYLSYFGGAISQPFLVERFVLYSSKANHGGGPYVIEETYSSFNEDVFREVGFR